MRDLPEVDWLTVQSAKFLPTLRSIIARKRHRHEVNTYSGPKQDKAGQTIFTLGYDDKPDSDWGRYSGHKVIVRLRDVTLSDDVEEVIRNALWGEAA